MMKITKRIVIGYALLAVLLGALAIFQIRVIHRMQAEGASIALTGFNSAVASLHLIRDRNCVEEDTRKLFTPGGSGDQGRLKGCMEDFEAGLRDIKSGVLSPADQEVNRLGEFWRTFVQDFSREAEAAKSGQPVQFPVSLQDDLERLQVPPATKRYRGPRSPSTFTAVGEVSRRLP